VARTSKHILMFAFDPLSLISISLISCITLHCSYSYARYCLCVSALVFNQESLLKHLNLNLEESRGVVPELFTENSDSLLVTHSVFVINFLIPHYLS